jgi:Subtilase family/CARDB
MSMRRFLMIGALSLVGTALVAGPSSGRVAEGVTDRGGGALAPLPSFQAQGRHLVRLMAGAFDPLRDALPSSRGIARRDERALPAGQPQYWLVQVRDGRFPDANTAIETAGARVAGVVPDATYLVRATPAQRARFTRSDAVRWTGYYQPAWRVPTAVGGRKALVELEGMQTYRVYAFRGDPAAGRLGQALSAISGVSVMGDGGSVVDVRATAAELAAIAFLPAVEWVELAPELELLNANARWVTDTGVRDLYAATAPGRLTGAGQTAGVADTAVNYTTDRNGLAHIGFRDCPGGTCKLADYTQASPGNTPAAMDNVVANNTSHRKMAAFFDIGNTGPNPGDDAAHGSHVAGSVTGDQGANGTPDGHDGMAPGARLVHQNIGTAGGGLTIPTDLYDVFRQAYRPRNPAGVAETSGATGATDYADYVPTVDARTHNNSWSSTLVAVPNSALSMVVDRFVWDHEDMVIVFSAGNGGPAVNTFSAPSNAKNDISSGASANGRQPMVSIDSMASFSSHGPTQDGRFGPDVATPGQIVVSTKGGTTDGYHYLQGTSMSGPVLTGLATLVRQYFYDGYAAAGGDGIAAGAPAAGRRHNPSAALVKAALVNSAVRMRGWYTGTDGTRRELDGEWPSAGQGFGRVNLDNGLYFSGDPSNAWYQDVWRGNADAFVGPSAVPATRIYSLRVQAGEPFDVTLSWTDAPTGLPAGSPALVNNLDLTVTGPTGTVYVGNNMNSRTSPSVAVAETPPGAAAPDVKNVTERVRIAAPVTGTYTLTVTASPLPSGNQGFALAASGRLSAAADQTFTPGPARQVDAAGNPTISNVRVEPVTSDTAIVRFTTSEPTTATATAAGNTYVDSYNVGNDPGNVGGGGGFAGLNEAQVETSADYANRPVLGTQHELLLTGLSSTTGTVSILARDLANNEASATVAARTASGVFGADAPDIGQLISGTAGGWRTGTQLYAGTSGTTIALGAFMFRVPASVDPSTITGASVELTSMHDLVARYTQDPILYVDLLDSSVESAWGTQTYEQIHGAASDARLNPETTHKRGAGSTYAFTFSCLELQALKDTLASVSGGQRLAAFRWDSTAPGLFSVEPGFNRRSQGPDKRPRLVLFTSDNPNPYGRACDPATPAPTISGVGIHEGVAPGSMTVSWETDVASDSMVLFRKQTETAWTQVGTPALTKVHQVRLLGLDLSQDYVFVVRSAACNGNATTDTNGGRGYAFFKTVVLGPGTQNAFFDFESGDQGWTTTRTTTQDPDVPPDTIWTRTSDGAGGSATGWHAEPYGDLDDSRLISPPIQLTGTLGSIEFFVRHDFEVQPALFTTNDALHVESSTDGGGTWSTIATYKGQSAGYPAYVPKTVNFPASGSVLVRFKVISDDNISTPPFQGAAVDQVRIVSYTPTGGSAGDRPLSGPASPPSAGETGLTAPAVRSGPASAADAAAGTGMCTVAGPATAPDLQVTSIVANNNKSVREGDKVTVTATVTNTGTAQASASKTQFLLDNAQVLGLVDTPALAPNGTATVSVQWDTRSESGTHVVRVTADQANAVLESDEGNNVSALTVNVKGNKVKNGSFEQSTSGSSPDNWTSAGSTSYESGGSDGQRSAGAGPGGSWTSDPISVDPAKAYALAVSASGAVGTVVVQQLSATGTVLSALTVPTLAGGVFAAVTANVTTLTGASTVRIVLQGGLSGTTTFDDVRLFEE